MAPVTAGHQPALLLLLLCLFSCATARLARDAPGTSPYGLRLAFGDGPGSLTLTWSTDSPITGPACVQLSQRSHVDCCTFHWLTTALRFAPLLQVCGTSRPFTEPSTNETSHFVHGVALPGHPPSSRWSYRCGSPADAAWSAWHPLPALPHRHEPTRVLLVGDMGVLRALTLPALLCDASSGIYSALLHVGDLAYDLASLRGVRGKQFLRRMQPITSLLPYMVSPGNHEAAANFSHFRALFTMPGHALTENLFYSYDIGPLHVVSYNTEAFFWPDAFRQDHMQRMFAWMEADLRAAASNRAAVPWVVVVGHRPMYCAKVPLHYTGRCAFEREASRRGLAAYCPHNNPQACRPATNATGVEPAGGQQGWPIEELFQRYGVDVAVFGHVHDYERYNAVYNYSVHHRPRGMAVPVNHSSSSGAPAPPAYHYVRPRATVHVVSGAGGNSEMRTGLDPPPRGGCTTPDAPWCAFQSGHAPVGQESYDFSYSRVAVHNATHLQWQQFSVTSGAVVDDWWVVQDVHGPWGTPASST